MPNFWNNFYKTFSIQKPSNFAKYLINKKYIIPNKKLIDIGCGNGRDTFYFKKKGINSFGIDNSETIINLNKKKNKILFSKVNFCDENLNLKVKFDFIYCRFFLHTISDIEEKKFLKNLKKISNKKSKIFLEFRTVNDPLINYGEILGKYERMTDHYRRFINVNDFKIQITKHKLNIIDLKVSKSFARFGDDCPEVCRAILEFC